MSKQVFLTVLLDSTLLGFQDWKNEDTLFCSIIPTAMGFKNFILVSYLLNCVVAAKSEPKHGSPNVKHCFCGFFLIY